MSDGRLLMPAAGAWGGVLLGTAALGAGVTVRVAAVAVTVLAATCATVLLARRSPTSARRTALLIAGLTVSVGVLAAGIRADGQDTGPVPDWAEQRATAEVFGVIVAEPRTRTFADSAPWQQRRVQEVPLATSRIVARARAIDVEQLVMLRLPAGERVPPPGSIVRASGRLGARAGPDIVVGLSARQSPVVLAHPGPVDAAAHAMREGLRAAVRPLHPDAGALVAGLAVGDESGQSEELDAVMRTSGLSHLTAVSGGNVAVVVAVVVGLTTLVGLRLLVRVGLSLAALAFFVVLVGFQPSVLRAAAMGAVVLIALLAGGRRPGPSVLATTVLVLVIVSPGLATSWGFALSVVATGALILGAPALADALGRGRLTRRWPPGLRLALAVTLAAQLGTAPVLVLMGASLGWVGVPANLLAMPAVPAVTVLGLAAAVVSPVLPPVAGVLAWLASWPAAWIAGVAFTASSLPGAVLPVPEGWPGVVLLGAVMSLAMATGRWARRHGPWPRALRAVAAGAGVGLALLWMVLPPGRRAWPPPDWLVIMCDVGQGDAVLLRSGPAAAVVVDVGPHPDRIDRCLEEAGVAVVPAVLLTHFHADHVMGLPGVLRDRQVGTVLVSALRDPAEQYAEVEAWLREAGLSAEVITAGDQRVAGAVSWRALWPRRIIRAGSAPNNASLVLDVAVQGHAVLLTGDIEAEAQAAVAASLRGRRFAAVKVPHHGSPNQGSLPVWARADVALVSVGADNAYGHPAASTLEAWAGTGALVLRTDEDGDIAIVPNRGGVGAVTRR